MERVWQEVIASGKLLHTPLIDGAQQGISELQHHEIWLVTARPSAIKEVTLTWLNEKRIYYDHILFDINDKHLASPDFDVFVDDFLDNVLPMAETGTFSLLFDQPWNQVPELPPNCRRIYTWAEVVLNVKALEND